MHALGTHHQTVAATDLQNKLFIHVSFLKLPKFMLSYFEISSPMQCCLMSLDELHCEAILARNGSLANKYMLRFEKYVRGILSYLDLT